jgi:N-acetylneuraminic acid mutarotase
MYVLGGVDDGIRAIDIVLKFDSRQGTWSQVAPMPAVRYGHAACAIGSDIYVFGGADDDRQMQASVFKFDTETNEWRILPPMPHACAYQCASVLDGLVYIVGAGASNFELLLFDPESGAWSMLATSIGRKYGASFVLDGCLYVAGGAGSNPSVECYGVASNMWVAVANMLEGRSLFGAVTIGSADSAGEQDLFDSLIAKALSRHP